MHVQPEKIEAYTSATAQDILIPTEIWSNGHVPARDVTSYTLFICDRKGKACGVSIYAKNSFIACLLKWMHVMLTSLLLELTPSQLCN